MMDDELIIYCGVYLIGVFISAVANVMLKKCATKKATIDLFTFVEKHAPALCGHVRGSDKKIWSLVKKYRPLLTEYLNPFTILSYVIFVAATLLTIFSYKVVPLTMAPILGASEYFFIAALSRIFIKEQIGWRKLLGLGIIVAGILIYSL